MCAASEDESSGCVSPFQGCLKRTDDSPSNSQTYRVEQFELGQLALPIHFAQNSVNLPPYRSIRFERQPPKHMFQPILCSENGKVSQVRFQLLVAPLLDSHMRMAAPIAHRVAAKFDGRFASIANVFPLLLKEGVLSVRCKQNEEAPVSEVLNVCEPGIFASGPRRLSDTKGVFGD